MAAELLAVEPLLDEFDPALVAAAALAGAPTSRPEGADPGTGPDTAAATWTRLFVTVGHRDLVKPGDVLGALMTAADLQRTDVGRIEVKERFSLVEVRPTIADRAIRNLTGEQIRGRRVTVRLDRPDPPRGSRAR